MIETQEIKGSKMIEAVVVMVGWGDDVDTQEQWGRTQGGEGELKSIEMKRLKLIEQ